MDRKEKYQEYLRSEHWTNLRRQKLSQHRHGCSHCGTRTNGVQVHHLNYRNWYDCTLEDLMMLCGYCHETLHEQAMLRGFDFRGMKESDVVWFLRGVVPYHVPEQARPLRFVAMNEAEKVRVPDTDWIILDKLLIKQCRTKNGGYTKRTVLALGQNWPPKKKFVRRLVGETIRREKYIEALNGRLT